jgi:hypothetical protein
MDCPSKMIGKQSVRRPRIRWDIKIDLKDISCDIGQYSLLSDSGISSVGLSEEHRLTEYFNFQLIQHSYIERYFLVRMLDVAYSTSPFHIVGA